MVIYLHRRKSSHQSRLLPPWTLVTSWASTTLQMINIFPGFALRACLFAENVVRSTTYRSITLRTSRHRSPLSYNDKMQGRTATWKAITSKESWEVTHGSTRILLFPVASATTKLPLPPAWSIWHITLKVDRNSTVWQKHHKIIILA